MHFSVRAVAQHHHNAALYRSITRTQHAPPATSTRGTHNADPLRRSTSAHCDTRNSPDAAPPPLQRSVSCENAAHSQEQDAGQRIEPAHQSQSESAYQGVPAQGQRAGCNSCVPLSCVTSPDRNSQGMGELINLDNKFSQFTEHWRPKVFFSPSSLSPLFSPLPSSHLLPSHKPLLSPSSLSPFFLLLPSLSSSPCCFLFLHSPN